MSAYFVSTTGNDSNPGTSEGSAKRTIQAGVNLVSAGDTLYVRGGTYDEHPLLTSKNGTDLNSGIITISAYPAESVLVMPSSNGPGYVMFCQDCSYLQFVNMIMDGSNVGGTVLGLNYHAGNNNHHIRVKGNEIRNCGWPNRSGLSGGASQNHNGITGSGPGTEILNNNIHHNHKGIYGSQGLIDGNVIHTNWSYGVHFSGGPEIGSGFVTITRNRVHSNGQSGFARSGPQPWFGDGIGIFYPTNGPTYVFNNLVYGNYSSGIRSQYQANGGPNGAVVHIYNNTVYGNHCKDSELVVMRGIWGGDQAVTTHIRNNISYLNGGTNISNETAGQTDHNLAGVDPLFLDVGGGDFRLKDSSPAIGAGADLSAFFSTDFFGNTRN